MLQMLALFSHVCSYTCNCIRIATAATANSIVIILLASHPMLQTTSHLLPPTCMPLPTAAFITTPLLAILLLQNLSEPFTLPYYNSRNSLHLLLSHSASISFSFLHAPLILPSIPFAFLRASTNCSIHYYPSTSYLTLLQNPSEPFGLPYRYYNSWNSLHLHLLHPQIQHKNFTKHFAPALCIVQITSKALCIATVPLFSWISSSDE
jgi:hypothetical protein